MRSLLVALALLAILLGVGLWRLLGHVFTGFGEELGGLGGQALARRYRIAAALKHADKIARRGGGPPEVLSAIMGPAASAALVQLRDRFSPTADTATLLSWIDHNKSPFAGRTAVLVAIGADIELELSETLSHTGRGVIAGAYLVDPTNSPLDCDAIQHKAGDLWEQLDAAIAWAADQAARIDRAFVAFVLRPPLSGSWALEQAIDPESLIRRVFTSIDHDLWLTVRDAANETAWPASVTVTFPTSRTTLQRALSTVGVSFPRTARWDDRAVTLPGSEAASLVASIAGLHRMPMLAPSGGPLYSPAVTLTITESALAGNGGVVRDTSETEVIQSFLRATAVRILASSTEDVDLKLPLSTFPTRTVAWQLRSQARPVVTDVDESQPPHVTEPLRWLEEATAAGDESVAAAVLAHHGRAWLELAVPQQYLNIVTRVHDVFPKETVAFLWSHYLLALDSALRHGRPDESWFTAEYRRLADRTELGILFHAEHMEFCRLRGDTERAVNCANELLPVLSTASAAGASSGAHYAIGTARYVTANLFRAGGRYEDAKQLIADAVECLNIAIPSHRIELTHAIYGTGVCDSMFGVASIMSPRGWSTSEAVFGRSLITLANSHASWFISDYERAAEFAGSAQEGFATIGYRRYSQRAETLARLIRDWAQRAGEPIRGEEEPDQRVEELLRAGVGSRVQLLRSERPSRALSLLQFARAFGDAEAPRVVELPEVIGIDEDGLLALHRPFDAGSYSEAELVLRFSMGVGQNGRVPLAAD